jgi:hypothetical protein
MERRDCPLEHYLPAPNNLILSRRDKEQHVHFAKRVVVTSKAQFPMT